MICILKQEEQRDWVRGYDGSNPVKVDATETTGVAVEVEKLDDEKHM